MKIKVFNGNVEINGGNSIILSKNNNGIEFNSYDENICVNIKNLNVYKCLSGFNDKIKLSLFAVKFIWKKTY